MEIETTTHIASKCNGSCHVDCSLITRVLPPASPQDVGLLSESAYTYSASLSAGNNEACQNVDPTQTFKITSSENVPTYEGALQKVSAVASPDLSRPPPHTYPLGL